jgi:hypothetical protein
MALIRGCRLSRRTDGGKCLVPRPSYCASFGAEAAILSTTCSVLVGRIGAVSTRLHFPRKPIGEQAPADEISPPHLRGRKLPKPGSVL